MVSAAGQPVHIATVAVLDGVARFSALSVCTPVAVVVDDLHWPTRAR
jgi:hypothetical protein